MSGHNADFIPDAHHAFTKKQLTELLTRYGKISELWFDMGANTPEQSRELYQLVHQLQPDCMVSGRLGNDQYDFASWVTMLTPNPVCKPLGKVQPLCLMKLGAIVRGKSGAMYAKKQKKS